VAAKDSPIENEVKIRISGSVREARTLIESRGYREKQPRTLESDQVFDRADELRASRRLLRLRREGGRATITYKGPPQAGPHKTREEIEFDSSDAAAAEMVLGRLGYSVAFRYEKYRTKFAAEGEPGIVTIDETPMGIFLELEGPPAWVDATAARLGLSQAEYLTSSYAKLYEEYRRDKPAVPVDMVFQQ
jgi:adenylate cyclase, class 2